MRRRLLLLLAALLVLALPSPALAGASPARAAATPPTSPAATTPGATTPGEGSHTIQTSPPLERDLSECISALPPPGCGHAPEQPGDRGGWLQWTLFGMMLLGLAFIGWRVVAGARRVARDAR